MKRLCDFYIRHAGMIGAAYCAVPALAWFTWMLFISFRQVYVFRLVLCLVFGCAIAAYLNYRGVQMWLCKHRSQQGPASIMDGVLVGAAIGMGAALLPSLTSLIYSNHLELAKSIIIITYVSAAFLGGVIGAILAVIGGKYIERDSLS